MKVYFDLIEDGVLNADDIGVDFETLMDARDEAARAVIEAAKDRMIENKFRSIVIRLRDANGRVVNITELRLDSRNTPN